MKVITMESSAYKEMMAQIANIAGYIREARDEKKRKRNRDKLLDTAQAAKMLNVSKRTMQRMRTDHRIEYVVVRGSCRYRLSEILRLLEDNTVRNEEGTMTPCSTTTRYEREAHQRKEDIGHGTAHETISRAGCRRLWNGSTVRTNCCWR